MDIHVGDKFLCIKNVEMDNGKIEYLKGRVYTSEVEQCITDNSGNKHHGWLKHNSVIVGKAENHFKKITDADEDRVNHPSHYTWLKDKCGVEVIDITRHLDFDCGNAVKYLFRAGHKTEEGYDEKQKTIEDLKKAIWYVNDKIKSLGGDIDEEDKHTIPSNMITLTYFGSKLPVHLVKNQIVYYTLSIRGDYSEVALNGTIIRVLETPEEISKLLE